METILILLIGVVVAILLVGIAILFYDEDRKQRDLRMRQAMGLGRRPTPTGARIAPQEEIGPAQSLDSLTANPLTSVEAARFSGEWRRIQEVFGDDPRSAIADADRLAKDLMEARGYLEREPASVSRGDSVLIENYRRAHRIAQADDGGQAGAAELRQAIVYYRSLFEELLETEEAVLIRS
ncbi:MAG: hypothetical protein E6J43_09505 [Chloroflexi bacterium]|nr:MAG: hypothetical protein E6J43_09505 [Chloroflexota bacterium]